MGINLHIRAAIGIAGSQVALAQRVGCSQQTISRYLNQQAKISAEHALAIHRATGGQISKSALRPDLWPGSRRRSAAAEGAVA